MEWTFIFKTTHDTRRKYGLLNLEKCSLLCAGICCISNLFIWQYLSWEWLFFQLSIAWIFQNPWCIVLRDTFACVFSMHWNKNNYSKKKFFNFVKIMRLSKGFLIKKKKKKNSFMWTINSLVNCCTKKQHFTYKHNIIEMKISLGKGQQASPTETQEEAIFTDLLYKPPQWPSTMFLLVSAQLLWTFWLPLH